MGDNSNLQGPLAGTSKGQSPGETMEEGKGGGSPNTVGGGPGNPPSPSLFGGHRGGKKTYSGHPVGSPEHAEWKRERDAERKRNSYAAKAASRASVLAPPPLPPLPPKTAPASPPGVDNGQASLPGMGPMPGPENLPQITWVAKDVEPLTAELVALTEELATSAIVRKCRKANLPKELIREVETDLEWADRSKKMLSDGVAEIAANSLNDTQVPLAARPWIKCGLAAVQIGVGHMKVLNRLDKLIATRQGPSEQPQDKPQPAGKSAPASTTAPAPAMAVAPILGDVHP